MVRNGSKVMPPSRADKNQAVSCLSLGLMPAMQLW